MIRRPVLSLLLLLLAAFSQMGCWPVCDPSSEDYDPDLCSHFLLGLTEVVYGGWQPPSPPGEACFTPRCQGAPCRSILENGNFERTRPGGFVGFQGDSPHEEEIVCRGRFAAAYRPFLFRQLIELETVLTPEELADLTRLRLRASIWANSRSPSQGDTVLLTLTMLGVPGSPTRSDTLRLDSDSGTWEPLDITMTLPAETRSLFFDIETRRTEFSRADFLLDVADVVIDYGNRPPTANDQEVPTSEDTPVRFIPFASDPDGEIDHASLRTNEPEHGTVVNGVYIPPPDYVGDDAFTYSIADDHGLFSNEATVTVHIAPVNDAPEADDDSYTVPDGTLLLVPAAIGVLANDGDVEGDTLTAVLVDTVENGTLSLDANGGFSYTPDAGFVGTDTFTYRATDGADTSAVATVSLAREETGYDLAIEKTTSATTIQQGQAVTFTIRITNNGPGEATGIRVRDRMTQFTFELTNAQTSQGTFVFSNPTASGTWTVGALDAGDTATLTIRGFPQANLTNTATITDGLGAGDDDDNNEDQVSVTVQ